MSKMAKPPKIKQSSKVTKSTYPGVDLGVLPVDLINDHLGTELEPGQVWLSNQAHSHMALDHAADYPICFPALREAIANPTFVGQAPKHANNFEILKRLNLPDGKVVLVAIGIEQDEGGKYRVRTSYLIPSTKVDDRREKGYIKQVIK